MATRKFADATGLGEFWSKVKAYVTNLLSSKQDTLTSGDNIKTVNGNSLLGSGDLSISASLPSDNVTGSGTSGYIAKFNGANSVTNGPAIGSGTTTFLRNDGTWVAPPNSTYNFSGTTFYSGNNGNAEHNANNALKNGHYYYTSNGPSTSLGAKSTDGALYVQSYSDSWVGQIAQDYLNGNLFVRSKSNGSWTNWESLSLIKVDKIILKPTNVTSKTNTYPLTSVSGHFTLNTISKKTAYWYSERIPKSSSAQYSGAYDYSYTDSNYTQIVPAANEQIINIEFSTGVFAVNEILSSSFATHAEKNKAYYYTSGNYRDLVFLWPDSGKYVYSDSYKHFARVPNVPYVILSYCYSGWTDRQLVKFDSIPTTLYGTSDTEIAIFIYYI